MISSMTLLALHASLLETMTSTKDTERRWLRRGLSIIQSTTKRNALKPTVEKVWVALEATDGDTEVDWGMVGRKRCRPGKLDWTVEAM